MIELGLKQKRKTEGPDSEYLLNNSLSTENNPTRENTTLRNNEGLL